MSELLEYVEQFTGIFSRNPQLSDIKPSAWAEKNIVIPGKGRLNYDFNPYCKEVIDTMAPKNNRTKMDARDFARLTGWGEKCSVHARDAAMLVYGW